MICIWFDNKLDWLGLAYGLVCGLWSIVAFGQMGYGKNQETDEEHDEDCELQLTMGKFDRDGE